MVEAEGDDRTQRDATRLDDRLAANSPLDDGIDDDENAGGGGSVGLTAVRSRRLSVARSSWWLMGDLRGRRI
jgi:hypothetical protein